MTVKERYQKLVSQRNAELDEIKARLDALEKVNEESEDEEELKNAGEEIDKLKARKEELEKELDEVNKELEELDKPAEEEKGQRAKFNFMKKEERGANKMNIEEITKRAEEFAKNERMVVDHTEARAMLVSSGKLVSEDGVSGIHELNKEASSLLDMVNVQDCTGMQTNTIAYEFTAPVGGITVEGEAYQEGETVTDFVTTSPQKVTVISYISEEARKLKPLAYEALVKKNAMFALRKKASSILVEKLRASTLNVAKNDLTKIDANTLRNIALNYGGDEYVEGNAILVLNKKSLVAFGDVRGTNEKKAVYDITPNASNPNTGIIAEGGVSVQYVLNENIADNTMIYGQAKKFELDLFSNYEVKVSEDFKFDKGLLAIRGSVMLDGAVTFKNGFVVVTIAA